MTSAIVYKLVSHTKHCVITNTFFVNTKEKKFSVVSWVIHKLVKVPRLREVAFTMFLFRGHSLARGLWRISTLTLQSLAEKGIYMAERFEWQSEFSNSHHIRRTVFTSTWVLRIWGTAIVKIAQVSCKCVRGLGTSTQQSNGALFIFKVPHLRSNLQVPSIWNDKTTLISSAFYTFRDVHAKTQC